MQIRCHSDGALVLRDDGILILATQFAVGMRKCQPLAQHGNLHFQRTFSAGQRIAHGVIGVDHSTWFAVLDVVRGFLYDTNLCAVNIL